ncbi:TetR/AcrR family transcriptional regulator [Christensenellaceae bacterium OttesenSCG-928-K19]|nr:TetR/AcrR family transcriptional regulator [Christensenellaceae bacterium OttesenSCG-928-K19]
MNRNEGDRRVRKTKKALWDALNTLLAEKNINDISVREITELADVSRSAFYLHYQDLYALQAEIENEVTREIIEMLDGFQPEKDLTLKYQLFLSLLTYVKQNDKLGRLLLGKNGNRSFWDKLYTVVEEHCLKYWAIPAEAYNATNQIPYYNSFVVTGVVSIVSKWVLSGMGESPEELALMLDGLVSDFITASIGRVDAERGVQ